MDIPAHQVGNQPITVPPAVLGYLRHAIVVWRLKTELITGVALAA
jgi:hypothetical protein